MENYSIIITVTRRSQTSHLIQTWKKVRNKINSNGNKPWDLCVNLTCNKSQIFLYSRKAIVQDDRLDVEDKYGNY